ncbi:MAG: helix-turn-helix transcriptional regulator [Coriobacteriia bacterium]|nr:helix-turn-helix transcriptional regulator [Coriobacteriia bacterium]
MDDTSTIELKLGQHLKKLRQERTGLSQEKFAYRIDMDRTYYAAIELGRHSVTLGKLAQIAEGLGMTLEELFRDL